MVGLAFGNSRRRRSRLVFAAETAIAVADATGSRWAVAVGEAQRDDRGNQYVEVVFFLRQAIAAYGLRFDL